jgi:tetratricopeptide (TPR) repeat protein
MPDHGIGVVALTNSTDSGTDDLPHLVAAYAYERLLGKPDVEARYREELDALAGEVGMRLRVRDQLSRAAEMMPGEAAGRLVDEALREALDAGITSESGINNRGYEYLNEGSIDMAVAVFEFNARAFPQSANPHDSLGEALERAGRLREAEEAYARAVELSDQADEDHATFRKNLDRVREKLRNRP